jgi:hypothetical protein
MNTPSSSSSPPPPSSPSSMDQPQQPMSARSFATAPNCGLECRDVYLNKIPIMTSYYSTSTFPDGRTELPSGRPVAA